MIRERLCKRGNQGLLIRIALGSPHQHTDAPHALALLRARREGPSRRAAEQRDELAAFHSITCVSSGRALSAGIVMPSALAVLRFTTRRSLVGNSIGRSPRLLRP